MALYEIKQSPEGARYSLEISPDPTGRRREIDVVENSINKDSIFIQTSVYFLDEQGERINNAMNRPYNVRIHCDKNGPFVDPSTGNRLVPIYDEDGNITNGAVTTFYYLNSALPFPQVNNFVKYMDAITTLELQYIIKADQNGDFNI